MAYSLPNVKPIAVRAANDLGRKFGIKVIGGYADRNIAGTSIKSDHAYGLALDFMCSIPTGDRLAAYAKDHAAAYGITYIIHNRKIWSVARSKEGWRTYSGENPHTDHVHISFKSSGGGSLPTDTPDAGASTGGGGGTGGAQASPAASVASVIPGPWNALGDFLTAPGLWLRVAMFIGGVLLFLIATGNLIKVSALAASAVKQTKAST